MRRKTPCFSCGECQELTNKILDMQVKDKYLNPIVVDINQKGV